MEPQQRVSLTLIKSFTKLKLITTYCNRIKKFLVFIDFNPAVSVEKTKYNVHTNRGFKKFTQQGIISRDW